MKYGLKLRYIVGMTRGELNEIATELGLLSYKYKTKTDLAREIIEKRKK